MHICYKKYYESQKSLLKTLTMLAYVLTTDMMCPSFNKHFHYSLWSQVSSEVRVCLYICQ